MIIACLNCLNHSATRSCPPRPSASDQERATACVRVHRLTRHPRRVVAPVCATARRPNPFFTRSPLAVAFVRSFGAHCEIASSSFLRTHSLALSLSFVSPLLSCLSLSLLHFSLNNLILAQSSRPLINSLRRRRDDKPSELMKACSDRSLALARSAKSGP